MFGQAGVILKAQSGRWWARTSAPILRRLVTCLANAAVLCALGPQKYLLSISRAAGQADAGKQHAQCASQHISATHWGSSSAPGLQRLWNDAILKGEKRRRRHRNRHTELRR